MGAVCGIQAQQPTGNSHSEDFHDDATNHGSGWGVPMASNAKVPEANNGEKVLEMPVTEIPQEKSNGVVARKSFSKSKTLQPVIEEIIRVMNNPDHDDGSMGPIFIRLAWHSCGTYDAATNTGGSSMGATMRFSPESNDPENAGLDVARKALEPVRAKFPWLSFADLWILAGTVAIKEMGGPDVEFRMGRKDHPGPESPIAIGRLPVPHAGLESGTDSEKRLNGWQNLTQSIRATFTRMGFTDQETVALVCGGHVFGRGHVHNAGYAGAWVEKPTEFSNEYASDLIGDEWRLVDGSNETDRATIPAAVCPAHGRRQYVSKPFDEHPQMMLPSDMIFLWDENYRVFTTKYAEDEGALKTDFGLAWKKLIELGCEKLLQ